MDFNTLVCINRSNIFEKNGNTETGIIIEVQSAIMALDVLIYRITTENGDYVLGVVLDFSKPFDTADLTILMQK